MGFVCTCIESPLARYPVHAYSGASKLGKRKWIPANTSSVFRSFTSGWQCTHALTIAHITNIVIGFLSEKHRSRLETPETLSQASVSHGQADGLPLLSHDTVAECNRSTISHRRSQSDPCRTLKSGDSEKTNKHANCLRDGYIRGFTHIKGFEFGQAYLYRGMWKEEPHQRETPTRYDSRNGRWLQPKKIVIMRLDLLNRAHHYGLLAYATAKILGSSRFGPVDARLMRWCGLFVQCHIQERIVWWSLCVWG